MAIDGNEATTLNYDLRLKLETSFTGKDMLTTVLRLATWTIPSSATVCSSGVPL